MYWVQQRERPSTFTNVLHQRWGVGTPLGLTHFGLVLYSHEAHRTPRRQVEDTSQRSWLKRAPFFRARLLSSGFPGSDTKTTRSAAGKLTALCRAHDGAARASRYRPAQTKRRVNYNACSRSSLRQWDRCMAGAHTRAPAA